MSYILFTFFILIIIITSQMQKQNLEIYFIVFYLVKCDLIKWI